MAKISGRIRATCTLLAIFSVCTLLFAQGTGRFDLAGPKLQVRVARGGKVLPIASVPNLQPGDRLWLYPDLPPTQSVHYLLVAVFLRGTTNPPPDNWFYKIETWNRKVRVEGAYITVPDEAQQAILFLAPETGGDFAALRSAVQGRPGVFVRASQDLSEAGFEQARIEKYLSSIKLAPPGDSKALLNHSNLLARTLNLKPNEECFTRPVDQQYSCLTQTGSQTLLDDGHGQSVVSILTNGSGSDLINAASSTSLAGGGVYSAYVGAVVDLVRLTSGLHTAHYQYIPAIAFPEAEELNLRLNVAPSFHNPKSVIVIGLPSIQAALPPPLRPADTKHVTCLLKPSVVLPVEGAPLVFSTAFAHDLVLHINSGTPHPDIPLTADAFQGGLVLATGPVRRDLYFSGAGEGEEKSHPAKTAPAQAQATPAKPDSASEITGTIKGYWGFDPFIGPTLRLQDVPGHGWKLAADDLLIAGRENHLSLSSSGTACIQSISLETAPGNQIDAQWRPSEKPNVVDVTLSLKSFDPGALHLNVRQYGDFEAVAVAAQTYSEPAKLASLTLHAGDTSAFLTGTSLDQVQHLNLENLVFTPSALTELPASAHDDDHQESLTLTLPPDAAAPRFPAGEKYVAHVALKDGRTLSLPVTLAPARPVVTLLSKNISQQADSPIHLANPNDLPVDQQVNFSLRSLPPFPRTGQIEVATADDALHTYLSVANGGLVLQNPHTLLGTLDPMKTFGTSTFGPLHLRAVSPDGTTGDWLPLATLVRLPSLRDIQCAADASAPCTLTGTSLYLVESIDITPAFSNPVAVPEGFVGTTLTMPHPGTTGFYLKLRDDPTAANTVTMPVLVQKPPAPATAATRVSAP
ncbi:hypothetical protein [Edaphobacter bradus]|uniref:hypothetical protein n=1 Tax=Edaphobacter bradus TaxID=2259016 RepID=UPI0021DF57DA|nr:hypothetical protein [Edaphobacter bradus]